MNDVGGQRLAVGVARLKQNVTPFTDLIEWTRKYHVKDTGVPRQDPPGSRISHGLKATLYEHKSRSEFIQLLLLFIPVENIQEYLTS